MHILKLPWLNHTEEKRKYEVYSLSVSPDGTRLASGGLDGNVRIWSVADILRFKKEGEPRDPMVCRPLCSMARHTGAVTVVKFSPDGRFLASGSDDKVLLIWERDEEQRPVFGEQNLEHWTVTKRVVAHDNDIQDIAWAPDSSILVTVGLDRSIIIWNGNTFEKIKRFDVHQSHVKGVVFDPANKYFATSSDDRSVRIFRYHKGSELSFSIERTVLKPFKKSPLTTYYRRLSWSPDGQYIAVPNATNGPVTSVAVITRGNWDSDISLIGHDSPCEVATFSPVLYEVSSATNKKEKKISSVVATAGQDKNLAIWNNTYPRPIAVFEDISMKTVTDLCWSPDGLTLFVSSLDGDISVINFEAGELGQVVSSEKNSELLHKYGVDKDSTVFPESTQQLILEDKAAEFTKTLSDKHMDRLMSLEKPALEKTTPQPSPKPAAIPQFGSSPKSTPPAPSQLVTSQPATKQSSTKLNKVTMTNGKKRVAPTLISTTSHATTSKFKEAKVVVPKQKSSETKSLKKLLSKTPYDLPKFGIQTSVNPYFIKRTGGDGEDDDDQDEELGDEIDDYEAQSSEEEVIFKRRRTKLQHSIIKLQPGFDDNSVVYKHLSDPEEKRNAVLQVLNYDDSEEDEPTVVVSYHGGEKQFEEFIADRICCITGQYNKFWALATTTGSVLTYSPSGRMLIPRLELGGNVAMMTSQGDVLIVVTDDYMIHCYDVMKKRKVHKKVSLAPIVNYEEVVVGKSVKLGSKVLDVELHGERILVLLDNNEAYMYDKELRTWTLVLDNFALKYNKYNGVWVDRTKKTRSDDDDNDKEEEFVKRLTFLEGYKELMGVLQKHDIQKEVTGELETLYKDDMFTKVRSTKQTV